MSDRDDNRYGEDVCVGFALYCYQHRLTVEERLELVERLSRGLAATVEGREA